MQATYRIRGRDGEFVTVGQLQKAEGFFVLVAAASVDDVELVRRGATAKRPIKIYCEIGEEVVAVMTCRKIRAAADETGSNVRIWAIVG